MVPFGNDPAKIEGYRRFWNRSDTRRPLVGFTLRGWFPLQEYGTSLGWEVGRELEPQMVPPESFLDDEERLLTEGELFDDDILRGASPASAIIPWLEAALGARLRILPGSVLAIADPIPLESLQTLHFEKENRWFQAYAHFADQLVSRARGQYPVSPSATSGCSDILCTFRGHEQSIFDLMEKPEASERCLANITEQFKRFSLYLWQRLPLFYGGYFDAMYELWAPGPILRMQEDASGLYSPQLYQKMLQKKDSALAESFANAFLHLHSTSMRLLECFLEISALRCFEINLDASGPSVIEMIPFFKKVQNAGKALLVRGSMSPVEADLLRDSLEARGLMLLILVRSISEVEKLRGRLGL